MDSKTFNFVLFYVVLFFCYTVFLRPLFSGDNLYMSLSYGLSAVFMTIHYFLNKFYPVSENIFFPKKSHKLLATFMLTTGLAVYTLEFIIPIPDRPLFENFEVYYQVAFMLFLTIFIISLITKMVAFFISKLDKKIKNAVTTVFLVILFYLFQFILSFTSLIAEQYPVLSEEIGYFFVGPIVFLLIRYLFLPPKLVGPDTTAKNKAQ